MKKMFFLLAFTAGLVACKKGAGDGGTSTLRGKVYGIDYNADFSMRLDSGYAPNENVYVIYGDHKTYDDKISTNYDGTYEFKYLRQGTYTVYCYSKDSATSIPFGTQAIIQTAEITKNRSTVEIPTININK